MCIIELKINILGLSITLKQIVVRPRFKRVCMYVARDFLRYPPKGLPQGHVVQKVNNYPLDKYLFRGITMVSYSVDSAIQYLNNRGEMESFP